MRILKAMWVGFCMGAEGYRPWYIVEFIRNSRAVAKKKAAPLVGKKGTGRKG